MSRFRETCTRCHTRQPSTSLVRLKGGAHRCSDEQACAQRSEYPYTRSDTRHDEALAAARHERRVAVREQPSLGARRPAYLDESNFTARED